MLGKKVSQKNRYLQRGFTTAKQIRLAPCTAWARHRKNLVAQKKSCKLLLVLLNKCVANEAVTAGRKRETSPL